jgi:hypothetical protein
MRPRWFAGRHPVGHRLKAENEPLHALQQRVVQFAGDALALAHARFEARANAARHLRHAQPIRQPRHQERDGNA